MNGARSVPRQMALASRVQILLTSSPTMPEGLAWAVVNIRRLAICFAGGLTFSAKYLVQCSLVSGFDDEFIDVHVIGTAGDPDDHFGNVFAHERVSPFVNFLGPGNVTLET